MRWVMIGLWLLFVSGCTQGRWFPGFDAPPEDWQLKQVRSKWKGGPEFRHAKEQNITRWSIETGVEAELYNGQKVGLSYRRRDVSEIIGWNQYDNGFWLEWSFPLWKDDSRESWEAQLLRRIEALEQAREGETGSNEDIG